VGAPWQPYTSRSPTGRSTTPSSRHDTLVLPLFLLPPSIIVKAEKPSRHCHPYSGELACAHHRTTVHQISPNAPPWTPLPPPPLSWANRVEVRAHCRIRHRPPRTFLAGAPPCHGRTPLASPHLPSLVFRVCLEPLMLTGPGNWVVPPLSSPESVSRDHGPPLPSPTALAAAIAP
jgi:hypothetical protein